MPAFLITCKPSVENPKLGNAFEDIRKLLLRKATGEPVTELWRFRNRSATLNDRVFLLLQGRLGPAIVGYGKVIGLPQKSSGTWRVKVEFESVVDPASEALADRNDLRSIDQGDRFWRMAFSGAKLDPRVASELEALVVNKQAKRAADASGENPDWTRDELILALDLYFAYRPNLPAKESQPIRELSEILRRLGQKLFPTENRASTFRNENGVYMKLMNFRRLDTDYTAAGKIGLTRGAQADKEVWEDFIESPDSCRNVAEAIKSTLVDTETSGDWSAPDVEEYIQEAPEGRLLTRKHLVRERNRRLVKSKRKQVLKKYGRLFCEACGFDFAVRYGDLGKGFIECHHTKPVAMLADGHKTHINDLAIVCANCHRMIHRSRPWLSVGDLKKLMSEVGTV